MELGTYGREVLHAGESKVLELLQECGDGAEWIGCAYACDDGRAFYDGEDFFGLQ